MPKLAELNGMDRAEFTRIVAPVFEHSPWVAMARTCASALFYRAKICTPPFATLS